MIAVLNTSQSCAWAEAIGEPPWSLLPVANRPLLDYWLELCSDLGIVRVQVVLGEQPKHVEDFVGNGKRWNLKVEYVFARTGEDALHYLHSIEKLWAGGLLYLGGPFFMRRRKAYGTRDFCRLKACRSGDPGNPHFLYGETRDDVEALLAGASGVDRGLETIHAQPCIIDSIGSDFELNMKMECR